MNEFPSKNHPETCLKWGSKGVVGGRLQPSSRLFRAIKNLHGGRELVRMQKSMNDERNSPGWTKIDRINQTVRVPRKVTSTTRIHT